MANGDWMKKGADGLTFGERLKDLIVARGITQTKLAEEAGLSQSALSAYQKTDNPDGTRIENPRVPDSSTICTLAKYFGVSADYLLGLYAKPAADLNTRAICDAAGLSEVTVTLLLSRADRFGGCIPRFLDDCAAVTYEVLPDYLSLRRTALKRLRAAQQNPKTDLLQYTSAEYALDRTAARTGHTVLPQEDAIRFYARNIAAALERYLVMVYCGDTEISKAVTDG